MKTSIGMLVACVGACAWSDVVTISPASGVFTNVAERYTGDTTLMLNAKASGGGIVSLNPYNAYTGITSNGCGTLVLHHVDVPGVASDLGKGTDLMIGKSTLCYAGPDGATLGRDIAVNGAGGSAAIFAISNDLYAVGDVNCYTGSFVKTGAGTLHLAGTGTSNFGRGSVLGDATSGLQAIFTPKANGDPPTKGYRSFHVLEGTVVLGENGGIYNIGGGGNDPGVGGWTTDSGQEKEPVLEIRGGTVAFKGWVMNGSYNGKTATATDHRPASVFRILGGKVTTGNTFCLGRNKIGYSKFAQKNAPRFEIFGGSLTISGDLSLSDDRGANSVLLIRGGTVKANNAYTERCSGNPDTEVSMEVSGTGRVTVGNFYNGAKSAGDILHLCITNGGCVNANSLYNNAGTFDIFVDGGTIAGGASGGNLLGKSLTRVAVGTRGATFAVATGGKTSTLLKEVVSTNTVPGATPAGVRFVNETTSVGNFNLQTAMAWEGPTFVDTNTRIRFMSGGSLPAESPLTLAAGSQASLAVPAVVHSLALGSADSATKVRLAIGKGTGLTVENALTVNGENPIEIQVYDTYVDAWVTPTTGDYPILTVPKAYGDVLRALPITIANAETDLSCTPSFVETDDTVSLVVTVASDPDSARATRATTTAPTTATSNAWTNAEGDGLWLTDADWQSGTAVNAAGLGAVFPDLDGAAGSSTVSIAADATVTAGGLFFPGTKGYTIAGGALSLDNNGYPVGISSVAGGSNVIAAELAAATRLKVNAQAKNAGHVKIPGAGLAGGLTTGSGTTEIDTLAFVNAADDLVLGPGTLKYTGSGETIPGLTLNAGSSRAAILEVENDLTLESMEVGTSAFIKTGEGTLRFAGNGTFRPGNLNQNAGNKAGIGPYGDSPVDTIQNVALDEGTLVVGTVDDPNDAPTVTMAGEFDIGGRAASKTNGRRETAGALVMNNGSFACNLLELGYYCGTTNTVGEGAENALHAGFTLNGGTVTTPTFSTIWDWGYEHNNLHADIAINGGELNAGTLRLNSMPGVRDTNTTVWTQSGGVVRANSMSVGTYAASGKIMPTLTMNLDGGELRISGTSTFTNASPTEINVNTGAVLQLGSITALDNGLTNTCIRFRGGVCRGYTSASGNTEWKNHKGYAIYLADDLTFDTSGDLALGNVRRYWLYINHTIEPEPDSARTDYGITVVGGGQVAFGTIFANSTFTGPVRFTDGCSALPLTSAFENQSIVIDPGAKLRQYNLYASIKNLTLGATDAATPAYVDLHTSYAKTNYAVVVTGELKLEGPVAFLTHSDNVNTEPLNAAGTYTALVYRAENAIDTTKFTTAQFADAKRATFTEVTLPASDAKYPGWKALVVTIGSESAGWTAPSGARVWTAVGTGGDWSASANWNNQAAPAGQGETATFLPATAAVVPVRLDAPVEISHLELGANAAANGYTLSGAGLTMGNEGTRSCDILAFTGTHAFTAPLFLGRRTMLQTKDGAKVGLAEVVSTNQTFIVNNCQATGGGEVTVEKTTGVGTMLVGSGRLIIDDLSFATSGTSVQIGRGTLDYRGTGETIPGLYLQSDGGKCAVIKVEHDLGIKAMTYSSSGVTKVGPGDLYFRGTGTIKFGNKANNRGSQADAYVRANGDGPVSTHRNGNLSEGRIIQGTVGDDTDAPTVTCSDFCVGVDHAEGKNCEYILNNGTLNTTGAFYIDYYHGVTKKCRGKFTMNGGTLQGSWIRMMQSGGQTMYADPEFEINGGEANFTGEFMMGYQTMKMTGNTATLRVNGGRLSVGNILSVVYYSQGSTGKSNTTTDGILEINGGELFCSNVVRMCQAAANTAKLFLNGGTLTARNITTTRGKSYLTFNGGAYLPTTAATLSGHTAAYVSTNGAVFSTAALTGGVYTVSQALVTDPLLNGAPDGGFTKTGPGTLVLSGVNAFTGPTRVAAGMLRVTRDEALSDRVEIANAATLDMAARVLTVGDILTQGLAANGTLTVGGALVKNLDDANVLDVAGDLVVAPTAVVDFGLGADDALAFGNRIPLAVCSGAITAPARLKTRNAANVPAVKLEVQDGVLYAVTTSGGTLIIFR